MTSLTNTTSCNFQEFQLPCLSISLSTWGYQYMHTSLPLFTRNSSKWNSSQILNQADRKQLDLQGLFHLQPTPLPWFIVVPAINNGIVFLPSLLCSTSPFKTPIWQRVCRFIPARSITQKLVWNSVMYAANRSVPGTRSTVVRYSDARSPK